MPITNPVVTFVCPIIRQDFIYNCLKSLHKNMKVSFRVIVVDQTDSNEAEEKCRGLYHLWIKSYRNLGFSKAMNTGALLSNTKYICFMNDDLVFMDDRWWQGIEDTFATDERIIAVNPMSPREGAWGYGLTTDNENTWIPPKGFARDPDDLKSVVPLRDGKPFRYKEDFTPDDYDFLVNNHPCWQKDSLCDGIAMWCTVFSKKGLEENGLLDERFYPGSGEDYTMCCEAYSCAWPIDREECDPSYHRRMVGTTKSWVYHFWGQSKDLVNTPKLEMSRDNWNNGGDLWTHDPDPWGHFDDKGVRKPIRRVVPKFIDEL